MIGEAMLAIKALDSAFVLVQGAIAKKKDVEDMAGEVGKFFTAKKQVEQHIANAKQAGNDDLMLGSALEEAITIDQQEERIEKMMDKIRDHYSRKGQTHRWVKIKREAAKIEKKREVKRKQTASQNAQDELFIKDLSFVLGILVSGLFITGGIILLIFGFSSE